MLVLMLIPGGHVMAELDIYALNAQSPDATLAANGEHWRLFTDRVMGGVSSGQLGRDEISGRACLRMRGDVSLENNGGFVQMALDLGDRLRQQLPRFDGMALHVYGNAEPYNVHLRTGAMRYPWQSYRISFRAESAWRTIKLPFADFTPHRIDEELDVSQIRRVGLVAIGRPFEADLCVARVSLYQEVKTAPAP
jgi:hypothetical protein